MEVGKPAETPPDLLAALCQSLGAAPPAVELRPGLRKPVRDRVALRRAALRLLELLDGRLGAVGPDMSDSKVLAEAAHVIQQPPDLAPHVRVRPARSGAPGAASLQRRDQALVVRVEQQRPRAGVRQGLP